MVFGAGPVLLPWVAGCIASSALGYICGYAYQRQVAWQSGLDICSLPWSAQVEVIKKDSHQFL